MLDPAAGSTYHRDGNIDANVRELIHNEGRARTRVAKGIVGAGILREIRSAVMERSALLTDVITVARMQLRCAAQLHVLRA